MKNRKMMNNTITKKIYKKKKTSTWPFPYKPSPQNKKQKKSTRKKMSKTMTKNTMTNTRIMKTIS
jgi:hypothetical protein